MCELCRAWSTQSLCLDCLARLAPELPRCVRCALPLGGAGLRCGDCLREPPPFVRCVTLGDYGFPWDDLITAFKFRDRVDLAGPLAQALAARLPAADSPPASLVLPVPLSAARLAERGHNQAWELARRVAATLRLQADPRTLLRLRDTAHQVGLGREQRAANLRHAYWVDPARASRLHGRHVALVDDVLTTGATAGAAAQALLQAGAVSVQVWVLARTPRPQD
ncbi:MAG: ComF family protein [Burkholderiales bacterium]|nr:ComF family protein [Burkholderiales bacterium]